MKNQISVRKKILKRLNQSLLETTAHGLPVFSRKKHPFIKTMWMLFVTSAVGLCSYMMMKKVDEYLNFDVITKIRNDIKADDVQFPVITICNTNPMLSKEAIEYVQIYLNKKYALNVTSSDDLSEAIKKKQISPSEIDWLFYKTFGSDIDNSTRRSFGLDAETLIPFASFNNVRLNVTQEFVWNYNFYYGNCFKFNTNSTYKHSHADKGLRVELFAGTADYSYLNDYLNKDSGFSIRIEDQQSYKLIQNGFLIKPGTNTKLGYKRIESENLAMPYSKCIDVDSIDTLISREMKRIGLKYTRQNCLDIVMVKMAMDELGCYDMRFTQILNATPCDNFSSYLRLDNFVYRFNDTYTKYCPYECKTVDFKFSISNSVFPTYNYFNYKLSVNRKKYEHLFQTPNVSLKMYQKSFALILIKIDSMRMTRIYEAEMMTFFDLIANLGSIFGLTIGVSLLSFVEILDIFLDIIIIIIDHLKLRK